MKKTVYILFGVCLAASAQTVSVGNNPVSGGTGGGADNLGDHTATEDLNIGVNDLRLFSPLGKEMTVGWSNETFSLSPQGLAGALSYASGTLQWQFSTTLSMLNSDIERVRTLYGSTDNNGGIGDSSLGNGLRYFNHANIARLSLTNGQGTFWNANLVFGDHMEIYPTTSFLDSKDGIAYRFNLTGTPTDNEDIVTKGFLDNNYLELDGNNQQVTGINFHEALYSGGPGNIHPVASEISSTSANYAGRVGYGGFWVKSNGQLSFFRPVGPTGSNSNNLNVDFTGLTSSAVLRAEDDGLYYKDQLLGSGGSSGIADGSVTNAKIAANAVSVDKMTPISSNRIFGNNAGASANPQELTPDQVRAMLSSKTYNTFTSLTQTLTVSEAAFGNAEVKNKISNASDVTLSFDATGLTPSHYFYIVQTGEGNIYFDEPDAVTGLYYRTSERGDVVLVEYNGSGFEYNFGALTSYVPVSGAIYQGGDASDPSEGNNTNGWTVAEGSGNISVTSDAFDGSHAILCESNNNGVPVRFNVDLTPYLEYNTTYTIKVRFKRPSSSTGGNMRVQLSNGYGWVSTSSSGIYSSPQPSDFVEVQLTATTNASGNIALSIVFTSNTTIGHQAILDEIIIT